MLKIKKNLIVVALALSFGAVSSSTQAQESPEQLAASRKAPLTVVRRISELRVSNGMIHRIEASPDLSAALAVNRRTISPREGSSLWLFSNGGYGLMIGSDVEPLPSERVEKWMDIDTVWVAQCSCFLYLNEDDGCKFDGPATPANCNGPTCCLFKQDLFEWDGGLVEDFYR